MAKRTFDIFLSVIFLVLLSPVLLLLAIAIYFKLGRPIFYCQVRPGLNAIPFKMCKFRTMRDDRSESGHLLPDAERLSSFGRFLRSTSLDELPELWNVLRGEMSLVGPRPLLMQYLDRYTTEQFRRHGVMPGITGWAQIHGRNAVSWEERFKLDVWYVDNWSFWLDLRILFLTIFKIFEREGITAQGHVTMPEFAGSENHKSIKHEEVK
jgi:sugar transferase EpsL